MFWSKKIQKIINSVENRFDICHSDEMYSFVTKYFLWEEHLNIEKHES